MEQPLCGLTTLRADNLPLSLPSEVMATQKATHSCQS